MGVHDPPEAWDMISEKNFLSFSHFKSMEANEPQDMTSLGPRGLTGRIYVGDH